MNLGSGKRAAGIMSAHNICQRPGAAALAVFCQVVHDTTVGN